MPVLLAYVAYVRSIRIRAQRFALSERGEIGLKALVAVVVLVAAYEIHPQMFHSFVHWVVNGVFDVLHNSTHNKPVHGLPGAHPHNAQLHTPGISDLVGRGRGGH
jgi:hypothetical protein